MFKRNPMLMSGALVALASAVPPARSAELGIASMGLDRAITARPPQTGGGQATARTLHKGAGGRVYGASVSGSLRRRQAREAAQAAAE